MCGIRIIDTECWYMNVTLSFLQEPESSLAVASPWAVQPGPRDCPLVLSSTSSSKAQHLGKMAQADREASLAVQRLLLLVASLPALPNFVEARSGL